MFAKCGFIDDARKVFDELHERDLFTWPAMIGGVSREKRWGEVLELFCEMEEGVVLDELLFVKILDACGNCGDLRTTKRRKGEVKEGNRSVTEGFGGGWSEKGRNGEEFKFELLLEVKKNPLKGK
ncbi:hypothetical protein AgCh_029825 [Apium graveolens]